MYVFQYAPATDAGEPARKMVIGKRISTIRELEPGKKYMFRAALKGNREDLIYSEIISRYIA